ncbi:MAG: hypothetical protein ABIJ12_12220 [bacterium]
MRSKNSFSSNKLSFPILILILIFTKNIIASDNNKISELIEQSANNQSQNNSNYLNQSADLHIKRLYENTMNRKKTGIYSLFASASMISLGASMPYTGDAFTTTPLYTMGVTMGIAGIWMLNTRGKINSVYSGIKDTENDTQNENISRNALKSLSSFTKTLRIAAGIINFGFAAYYLLERPLEVQYWPRYAGNFKKSKANYLVSGFYIFSGIYYILTKSEEEKGWLKYNKESTQTNELNISLEVMTIGNNPGLGLVCSF